MIIIRLNRNCIYDLTKISQCREFPYKVDKQVAATYCEGKNPIQPMTQTYGVYENVKLVAVMTATYLYVFPHEDNPKGRIVHISGAYTKPEYRHRGYAKQLLYAIEKDAVDFFDADYLCCDSKADKLFLNSGFKYSSESRLWKPL